MLQNVHFVSRKGICSLINCVKNRTLSVNGFATTKESSVTILDQSKVNLYCQMSRTFATSYASYNRYKVLYDGDCKLCQKEIRVLKWMTSVNKRPVDFVDIASVKYEASANQGVTYEMAMKEMHVIDPEGRVHSSAEAIRQMYQAVGLSIVAGVTRLPGLDGLTQRMYVKFAEYRLQNALDNCDSGHCSVKVKQLRDKIEEEKKKKRKGFSQ